MSENEFRDIEKVKQLIIVMTKEYNPETTRELIYLIQKEVKLPEEKIFSIIQQLKEEKKLEFEGLFFPESIFEYLFSSKVLWFWIVSFLTVIIAYIVFTIPESSINVIYLRNIFGTIFVLYLPGYTLMKALYPVNVPLRTDSVILDSIERIALSLGASLVVPSIVGLVLYYTPIGLDLAPIVVSLLVLTVVFASIGIYREYKERKNLFLRRVEGVSGYELTNDILRFFDAKGIMGERRVIVKEIPTSDITNIDSRDCELSVTFNGVTHIFLMRNAKSSIELRDRVRGMMVDGTK